MSVVSELLALRIEVVMLKLQVLAQQQRECIDEARAEVQAPPDALYNVQTRQFQPREAD